MKYIRIENTGVLDVRLLPLMGGTTKEGQNKIGMWGSGLKYTIAFLLRNNIDFRIYCGSKLIPIVDKTEVIANTNFGVVYIENERTSITTNMGQDWVSWMIIRELYSNSLDEGGSSISIIDTNKEDFTFSDNTTTIYVQLTSDFKEVMDNFNNYFLDPTESPMYSIGPRSNLFKISDGSVRIYKKGILVKHLPNEKGIFRYNYDDCSINELRQLTTSPDYVICNMIPYLSEDAVKYFVSKLREDMYEWKVNYRFKSFSHSWKKALGERSIITKPIKEELEKRGSTVPSNIHILPETIYEELVQQYPEMSAVEMVENGGIFVEEDDMKSLTNLNSALAILESVGYEFPENITYKIGYFSASDTLASVCIKTREIKISIKFGSISLFQCITTMVEEFEHIKSGYRDLTREFQQHFINLFTKTLLKMNNIEL